MRKIWMLAALLAVAGCSLGKDVAPAKAAIDQFHQMLDRGDFARIYDTSAAEMKQSGSRDDLIKFLTAVHTKMGSFKTGQTTGWNENFNPGGTFVTLGYAATYQRGAAIEQFSYKIENGKPILTGYNINAPALIIN